MNATPRYSKQKEYSLDTSDNNNASTDGSDDTIVCVGGGGNSKIWCGDLDLKVMLTLL